MQAEPETTDVKVPVDELDESHDVSRSSGRDWRHPSIDAAVLLTLVIVGVRIGLSPLHDNSFMTHLATGRLIFETGSVPSHDPYSWSAFGHEWTVQSWGASVIYAGAEKLMGFAGIRLVRTACTVTLVLILWRLTEPAERLVGRLFIGGIAAAMGTALWVERPLLFGAVFLGVMLLAVESKLDPRWLVPTMWLWVNIHGSFPFGIAVAVLFGLGRWMDDRKVPAVELRALGWGLVGTVLGAVGPLGLKALTFPFELLSNRDAFARIQEWQPIGWDRGVHWFFAVQLAVALLAIAFRARRWRLVLPTVVFGVAAIASSRNILPATIVFTPILAHALHNLGRLDGRKRPAIAGPIAIALSLVIGFSLVVGFAGPNTDLQSYPQQAAGFMRTEGLLTTKSRVVSRDFVGNYLPFRYGPDRVRVFIDDRVDMYPLPIIDTYFRFIDVGPYQKTLDDLNATSVLWDRDSNFGRWLEQSKQWSVVYTDADWVVAVPRS